MQPLHRFDDQDPQFKIQVFGSTDFAGCGVARRSASGDCTMRGKYLLKHWSATQATIALSSGDDDLGGVV